MRGYNATDDNRSRLYDLPILTFLPEEVRKLIVDSFVPASFTFGQPIVREGEPADGFYVLVSGQARVVKQRENGEDISLNLLRAGDSFGEMGLLEEGSRNATVRATGDVTILKLDRSVFQALIRVQPAIRHYFELQIKHRHLHNFFRLYSPFARLPADQLKTLLAEFRAISFTPGELVIRQGDEPGPMYIVEEGRLRTFTEENGRRHYLAYLRKGDFFGELSVFKGEPRSANVEAMSPCKLLELAPATFEKLLKNCPAFKTQIKERIEQYDYKKIARVPLDFAEEALPADVHVHEKVGSDQVDHAELEDKAESRPFASPEGYFIKKAKRIRRFSLVRQIDAIDCGAACLAMVCRHFGRSVSLARIRGLVHTSLDGTSLRALCHAAEDLGLAARSVKTSHQRLGQMPLPAIVHWEGNHWLILYDVDEKQVRVADPAVGLRRIGREEFEKKWSGYAALFDYTEAFKKAPEGKANLSWLWPFFRPFTGSMIKALTLSIILSALQMVLPVFTQVVVDTVLVHQELNLLRALILSMVAVLLVMVVSMVVQRYLLSFAAVRIDAGALDFLVRKLLALPMRYFNARRSGDVQRRLEGIRRVREFVVQHAVSGLTALCQVAVAVALMFVYSSVLALVFLATAPLFALLMYFSSRWLRPIFDNLEEGFGKYHSHQIDAIKGIETVKASGGEGAFRTVMLNQFHGMARRQFSADFTIMCYEGAIQSVTFLSLVLFLWVGAGEVMKGALTIGGLVAFNSLVALANAPIVLLLNLWDNLQYSSVLLNRLQDIFEQEPEQGVDHSRLLPVPSLEGRIRLHKVGFRYGGPESPPIIEQIELEVAPGKIVAIVGRSGSGKTTLVKCLAGLLEPTEGTIFYDGVDLKALNYRQLRRQVGFVLQENYVFADTISRNIALGDDEPDMDRVIWSARMANAHEFIERLPLGYETPVGETGLAISGGQRQRIAIARALYRQPPVLIFDEATSNLDTESEGAIQQNMSQFFDGRTCFVIAHRLSTIRDADLIVVLEKGRIVEQGTHDDLMKVQGLYYYLASQQLGL
jgi:HlyB family type I secretion system ABC transporter